MERQQIIKPTLNYSKVAQYLNFIQSLGVFLLMFSLMSLTLPRFLTVLNLTNLMKQLSISWIIGVGMTIVIICGEFDISVGSILALAGVVAGLLIPKYGIAVGVAGALIIGVAVGIFNGVVTTKGRIPSFITTLGSMMMCRSLALVITRGRVISDFPDNYRVLGQGSVFGIPYLFVITIILYIIGHILLKRTAYGQHVYAVGSNRAAAILSGINADMVKIRAFIISGLLASLAGVLLASRVMAVQADTGIGIEFEVIAGVIIGGTSLRGGEGNVFYTILGVLIIGMIRNGLNMTQIDISWNQFVTGGVIVGAVLLDSLRKVIQKRIQEKYYEG